MPSTNLNVQVYPSDEAVEEPLSFVGIDYISFVSSPGGSGEGTYGIPALINDDNKLVGGEAKILYVNPANIAAMSVRRKPRDRA